VEEHWGADGVNWFGQGPAAAFGYAVAILAVLYASRSLIVRRASCPASALAWYVMLLAALLPAVWLLVVFDWDNQAVSAVACWAGTPIALLSVPTLSFGFDLATGLRLRGGAYLARSLLEAAVLVPIWAVLWVYCEFLVLNWVGP
jgi:hypothetical protein